MQGITHIRVDDRLIHGQVATFWTNELGVNRIMVINDAIANDPTQKSILRMAAPAHVSTSIITHETAVTNISNGKYAGQKVLVVVKSPLDVLKLVEAGLDITKFNVGNISSRPNTVALKPNISVTKEEREALEKLLDKGIEITSIMTPSDSNDLLKDHM
ncbi:PTS system mannose/fructose/N-acetylgalactosamine-transporter subunit IIB [Neobacillus sp. 19]|uniref:PTS system mannose/fructose/N-acetylgalactosamine-transporter subunit IIB n=1 Tax=Neobacillus sp. 19 TaxID=3394458 RepID=UPI003BF73EFE